VRIFDPVPMPMARLMGRERAQLLVESPQRANLHAFVRRWLQSLRAMRTPVRWHLEIDPGEI
jgi:primosomal protein N' (replication factor Y)